MIGFGLAGDRLGKLRDELKAQRLLEEMLASCASSQTMFIDDVELIDDPMVVPEPASAVLLGLLAVGMTVKRRRA